jgi:alpha-mannosidase
VTADGDAVLVSVPDVPAMGARTIRLEDATDASPAASQLTVTDERLENDHLRVTFDEQGRIRVYDRDAERSVLEGPGNDLRLYRDLPADFDAWDVDGDAYRVSDAVPGPETVTVRETGPVRGVVRQEYAIGDSRIVQDVTLYADARQVEFHTTVEWYAEERLLKTHFPIDAATQRATYDVQFGHTERPTHDNTSWDAARFEEFHHHWVDVSDAAGGAAVLNDCKYGVHVDGSDVGLSLLRAPNWPDPDADRGTHEFSYALKPHGGSLQDAGVVEAGYAFNCPVDTVPVAETTTVEGDTTTVDDEATANETEATTLEGPRVHGEGVVVESLKRAEDGDAIVFRLYEAYGRDASVTLDPGTAIADASAVSIVEDHRDTLPVTDDAVPLTFEPFEVKTVRVEPS